MNGIDIGRAARRWAWLIILLGVIAAVTAAAVSLEMPKIYQTSTTALVNPKQLAPQSQGTDPGLATGLGTDSLLQTYVSLIAAAPTARKLVADGIPRSEGQLGGSITAVPRKGTTLIDIVVRDEDPQVALAIAKDVVPAFNSSLQSLQATFTAPGSKTPQLDALVPWDVPTTAPGVPVSPKTKTNVLVALAAGLILGAALAGLLEFLDKSIKSEADVRIKLELPLLGAVLYKGRSRGFTPEREQVALVTVTHPKDPISESYRAIRTNLLFNSLDAKLRTLVVSSTVPGEGKTSTACNLAVAMAQAGNRVIIVDADFRRPELHRVFHKGRNVGLGNFILGDASEQDMILDTDVPNLRVICSGPTPPNPSELLGSQRMLKTIERLKELADVVIFDTPPVAAVTDATILAARTDGTILVVERGGTPIDAILQAKVKLDSVGARLLGIVLNKVRSGDAGAYYYYKYYAEAEARGKKDVKSKARAATKHRDAAPFTETAVPPAVAYRPPTNPAPPVAAAAPTGGPTNGAAAHAAPAAPVPAGSPPPVTGIASQTYQPTATQPPPVPVPAPAAVTSPAPAPALGPAPTPEGPPPGVSGGANGSSAFRYERPVATPAPVDAPRWRPLAANPPGGPAGTPTSADTEPAPPQT